jgi:hypothetical protein
MPVEDIDGNQAEQGHVVEVMPLDGSSTMFYARQDATGGAALSAPRSVPAMFSEHFIEHLSFDQAVGFLTAARAALQPKGVLRISTPTSASTPTPT